MNLDYKILWVDDNSSWVDERKPEIKQHILNKGFYPTIKVCTSISEIDISKLKEEDYDVFMLDYIFGADPKDNNGATLLKEIQDNLILTNVIFYSSNEKALKEDIQKKDLMGIYRLSREDFRLGNMENFFQILDFFMDRELDDNVLRGIAMSEVAKFDAQIWQLLHPGHIDGVIRYMREKQGDRCKNFCILDKKNIVEKLNKNGTEIFNSSQRKDYLHSKVLKGDKDWGAEYTEICNNYQEEVLSKRNTLAHELQCSLSPEEKIALRKSLIKFRGIYGKLQNAFKK